MKLFRRIGYTERAPFWYGLVRHDLPTMSVILAPIPLNIPLRALWLVYRWLSSPFVDGVHEHPRPRKRFDECIVCGREVRPDAECWHDLRRRQKICGPCVDEVVRDNVVVVMTRENAA